MKSYDFDPDHGRWRLGRVSAGEKTWRRAARACRWSSASVNSRITFAASGSRRRASRRHNESGFTTHCSSAALLNCRISTLYGTASRSQGHHSSTPAGLGVRSSGYAGGLIEAARTAGAEGWRGVAVREVRAGEPPAVLVERDGAAWAGAQHGLLF